MGKEGNQAAAFADYAIPRFKDLRRVLYWHGRPFGMRLMNVVLFCLYKAMIKSASNYGAQWFNGFSAFQPVEGMMHICFNILNTTFLNFFVCIYDQDVSFEKYGTLEKEKNMPVSMNEWVRYGRTMCDRKRFVFRVLLMDLYALISGFGICLIFFFSSGTMNKKGMEYGIFTYGIIGTVCVIWIHHFQVAMSVRNWTCWLTCWGLLSISFLPVTCFLAQMGKYTNMKASIFSMLLPSMELNAIIVAIVAAAAIPLLFHQRVHDLFLWPKFHS